MKDKIDVVITWVDGNDYLWKQERLRYLSSEFESPYIGGDNRFVDNGLLKYVLRGIDKFMPWVNKVHFVTFGHLPSWLNVESKKINIVNHSQIIDKKYLPTFNSNAILLNIYKIDGLSNKFIVFNDDMFVVKPCNKTLFFKKELPRDMACQSPIVASNNDPFWDMMINNVALINRCFDKKNVIFHNLLKWYSPSYGIKNILRNVFCIPYHYFVGFYDSHLPNAYLKNIFEDFCSNNKPIIESVMNHRFRDREDITEWAIRYWQLAKNTFIPINKDKLGIYTSLKDNSSISFIKNDKKYKFVCLNDECSSDIQLKLFIEYFNKILPNKCCFEK